MKKIYIAGKITGLPYTDYSFKFSHTEYLLRKIVGPDVEIINPIKLPHNHDKSWQAYMRECITALVQCDTIYVLPDWQGSRGARLEVQIAMELGMKTLFILIPNQPTT